MNDAIPRIRAKLEEAVGFYHEALDPEQRARDAERVAALAEVLCEEVKAHEKAEEEREAKLAAELGRHMRTTPMMILPSAPATVVPDPNRVVSGGAAQAGRGG